MADSDFKSALDLLRQGGQANETASLAPNLGSDGTIGAVEQLTGSGHIVRADGSQLTLQQGLEIHEGDQVITNASSSVGIRFHDETVFSMGSNAHASVDEMTYAPAEGEFNGVVNLFRGNFNLISGYITKAGPDALTVKTPVAEIGIRGTSAGFSDIGGDNEGVALLSDPDGSVGQIDVKTQSGQIVTLSQPYESTTINSSSGRASEPVFSEISKLVEQFAEVSLALPSSVVHPDLDQGLPKVNAANLQDRIQRAQELLRIVEQELVEEHQLLAVDSARGARVAFAVEDTFGRSFDADEGASTAAARRSGGAQAGTDWDAVLNDLNGDESALAGGVLDDLQGRLYNLAQESGDVTQLLSDARLLLLNDSVDGDTDALVAALSGQDGFEFEYSDSGELLIGSDLFNNLLDPAGAGNDRFESIGFVLQLIEESPIGDIPPFGQIDSVKFSELDTAANTFVTDLLVDGTSIDFGDGSFLDSLAEGVAVRNIDLDGDLSKLKNLGTDDFDALIEALQLHNVEGPYELNILHDRSLVDPANNDQSSVFTSEAFDALDQNGDSWVYKNDDDTELTIIFAPQGG
ncbi:MAG: FecR domain-containing protein [Actinomycetia bacterium]|nr:FecR domain-containing protein [Actinomycetes bacterium]